MRGEEVSIQEALRILEGGGTVVYPTETVYGLGGDALNIDAVNSVFDAKKRSRDKPLSIAVPDIDSAQRYAEIGEIEMRFMQNMLPGPVTCLLPKKDILPMELAPNTDKIGVRIPDNSTALEILREVNPITSTSANLSGERSPRMPEEISDDFMERVDGLVLGGEQPVYGLGSTVVDLESWEILRKGAGLDGVNKWIESNK